MDNIILDKWIDVKKGIKVRIQRKSNKDNTSIIIRNRNIKFGAMLEAATDSGIISKTFNQPQHQE